MHKGSTRTMHEIPASNGDEQDALYNVPITVFDNITGLRKFAKRCYSKRQRKNAREKLRKNYLE